MPYIGTIKYMRSIYGNRGMESHDEWYTDPELYLELCEKYQIYPEIDIAAHDDSHMCDIYKTKEHDTLNTEWVLIEGETNDIWMNPPLLGGLTKKFVLKAEEQWMKHNMNILAIVPAGVIARQWFRHLWWMFVRNEGVEIEPINRPKFLDHGEVVKNQARNDYIVLIFRHIDRDKCTEI